MWMFWMVWAAVAGAADCPTPATRATVTATLERAQLNYRDLDSDGFFTGMDAVMLDVPCLSEVLPSYTVAQLHRMHGVALFGRGDESRAIAALRAGNAADPGGGLPTDLVPPGHELIQLSQMPAVGPTTRIDKPARGIEVFLDGEQARDRPDGRPVLAQIVMNDAVTVSTYVEPGAPLPAYPVSTARKTQRAVLWTGAGVSLATSAVLYGLARSEGADLRRGTVADDVTRDDIEATRRTTNGLAAGSIAALALSGGLLTVAIIR